MNSLEKRKRETDERLKTFNSLQEYRNMDFPMNMLLICKNNLAILLDYFTKAMQNPNYRFKLDTIVQTYIINYLNSVKGYINRKLKTIDHGVRCDYKNDMVAIIRNYWHKGHKRITSVDKVIELRNCFEHEKIDNITFKTTFNNESIKYNLLYKDEDLLALFIACFCEMESMNKDIEAFIETTLKKCNLYDATMFNNAFIKHFEKGEAALLYPEPTENEIKKYDDLIDVLIKQG